MILSAAISGGLPSDASVKLHSLTSTLLVGRKIRHLSSSHPNRLTTGTPKAWHPQARAGVAQLVERKALNLVVKGSSPFFGDILFCCLSFFLVAQKLECREGMVRVNAKSLEERLIHSCLSMCSNTLVLAFLGNNAMLAK